MSSTLELDPMADDQSKIISPREMEKQAKELISRMPEHIQRLATEMLNFTAMHCSSRLQTIFLEGRMREGDPQYLRIIMQVFVEERYEIYMTLLGVLQEQLNAVNAAAGTPLPLEAHDWL